MIQRTGMGPLAQAGNEVEDVHPAPRANHPVQAGHRLHQRIAIALRQTASRNHHLVSPLDVHQLAQHIDGFPLGGIDEAAGIHNHHLGRIGIPDAAHALLLENLRHAFAVNRVLGAAKADQKILVGLFVCCFFSHGLFPVIDFSL